MIKELRELQKIIIVEGLDMTGKTTLVKELSDLTGLLPFKEIREERWHDHVIDLLYSEETKIQMLEQLCYSMISDRGYPSEWVYSKAFNRRTIESRIFELDERYAKLGAKIIILDKNPEKFQKDKTKLIDFEKYTEIRDLYHQFHTITHCKSIILDTSDENITNQLTKILKFLYTKNV